MAGQSGDAVRGLVRQVALLRPTSSGATKIVRRGATVVFATTIRPQTGALAARFRIYHWTGSFWTVAAERKANADAIGVASLLWTFPKAGRWYVRAMADSTVYDANSTYSQIERYDVR